MLKWIYRLFKLLPMHLPSNHLQDIAGSDEPTLDNLREEAIAFDKNIKDYIARASGQQPTLALGKLVRNVLKDYPQHPESPAFWDRFVKDAIELKDFRNNIIHSDVEGLPPVAELYRRFKAANDVLRPFAVCSASRERFAQFQWKRNVLNFKVDEQTFGLSRQDVENLLAELHPSSRGRVYFKAGKQINSVMRDIANKSRTYYIEGSEPFDLTDQEAMILDDLLICFLGNPALRMP